MRVLLLGSGGREHALAWKIAQSPHLEGPAALLAAPGSDAIAELARCIPEIGAGDLEGVVAIAQSESIDLVVVGPEDPLATGVADRVRAAGIPCFGPSAAAAQLEASKAFAKAFMERHHIPTAAFEIFDNLEAARRYVRTLGGPCVVKADGLAAGKGVTVCDVPDEAEAALVEAMETRRFGEAGARVVVEERLTGEEVSYYALSDGRTVMPLAAAQDHKRALDGDRGENTGGMGAYSPAPIFSEAVEKRVLETIVYPTVRGMAAEGCPFSGVLYVGLMIGADGEPRVVEFNARFGDPETQPLMLRMESDLLPLLDAAARSELESATAPELRDAAVCVVLASGGYPRSYAIGKAIHGLESLAAEPDVFAFHAGTRRSGDHFETAGGRVLGITARGVDVGEARQRAYTACGRISFEGMHRRNDIAVRAVSP